MATVTALVRSGPSLQPDVLIELFAVPRDFGSRLPIRHRSELAALPVHRLGSALSDLQGIATIHYDDTASAPSVASASASGGQSKRTSATSTKKAAAPNLWLIASRPGNDGTATLAYQDDSVRLGAASVEHYLVALPASASPPDDPDDPERPIAQGRSRVALKSALRDEAVVRREDRQKRIEQFRRSIVPALRQQLSTVRVDAAGMASDPDYVDDTQSVEAHALRRLDEQLSQRLHRDAPAPLRLHGRLSLTAAQRDALIERAAPAPGATSVTIDEAVLDEVLGRPPSTSGDEAAPPVLVRSEVVLRHCRPTSPAQRCLDEATAPDAPPAVDPAPGGGDPIADGAGTGNGPTGDEPNDPQPAAETPATPEGLRQAILKKMGAILDQQGVFDRPGADATPPSSDDRLSEAEVRARTAFPSLALPPGPAEEPAQYDFHSLQIAFKPVWSEALDESLFAQAETLFDRYVELGGDAESLAGQNWFVVTEALASLLQARVNPPSAAAVAHLSITAEQWNALPPDYRYRLEAIAAQISAQRRKIQTDHIGGHDLSDGIGADDINGFDRLVRVIETRVGHYREEAERLIAYAQDLLDKRAEAQSPLPPNRLLSALKTRALSAYPARYFAANRKERSVNFGLLVTYRQSWTPTGYQVGDLIKSLPLAPGQKQRYRKQIEVRDKRARREVKANLSAQQDSLQSTSRAESEIVQKALQKTNFNATVSGTFKIGVYDANASSTLAAEAGSDSAETKRSFHEAVAKAAREYKEELKVDIETENLLTTSSEEVSEISNPNDELSVTYLFYELQRRFRVRERLHRLQSVVLVAQEMPMPSEIDEDWLIAHRWILNRVLLDDGLQAPLAYVAESMSAEEHALAELKRGLNAQRRRVDELKGDVIDSRERSQSRYAALQASMERAARAAQRGSGSGGILGAVRKFTSPPVLDSLASRLLGQDGESPEAARVRESAARDAYEREMESLRDLEARLLGEQTSLTQATREFSDRLSAHLGQATRVYELINHVKDNILHYMQAIWLHEPPDQRWLRLKDVPVPQFGRTRRQLEVDLQAIDGALSSAAHLRTSTHPYRATCGTVPARGALPTRPLVEVAELDALLGFKANYMIFPLKQANAITRFMMEPYVDRAAGSFGITDPDDLGNLSLDEFGDYVCCLRRALPAPAFEALAPQLRAQLRTLLQAPIRDDEEIVVPLDALFIECLPGSHPILENFKLLHRQIDAADALESLRLKRLEKLRYAQRLLDEQLDDPQIDRKVTITGAASVVPSDDA